MVYILCSQDPSAAALKLEELQKTAGKGRLRIDFNAAEETYEDLVMELSAGSLFDEEKFIVVSNASFLSARNTSKYDPEKLYSFLETDQVLVVWVNGKIDKRKKIVKQYLKKAKLIEAAPFTARSVSDFIIKEARNRNLKLDWDAKEYICSHAGINPLVLRSELDKLKIYADHITLADARALVSVEPIDDVFKMTDALFERNGLRLLALYRNFREQNMEPMAILAILAGQVRFLFQVKVLMNAGNGKSEIAKVLGAHPYRIEVNMKKAETFSSDQLLEQLKVLADLDQKMKLGLMDKDLGFEQFILSMIETSISAAIM